ncbi:MAG: YhdP family protein [Burkholderiaceae bacterium]
MKDLAPSPSRLWKAAAAATRWALGLLLAAWLLFLLAWGVLHGWIVPRIDDLRPRVEIEASRALGVPVRIGAITARSAGLMPSFELREVSLHDREGREALRLPRVLAALSPRSLMSLGFEQLYLDQPELDIRRSADGRIHVAGLDLSRSDSQNGRAADWFFSQTEFVIRNGTLRWSDEQRAAAPLALSQVDFVMRNRARRHELRLDATPPPAWGERFSLVARFRQPLLSRHAGQWQQWEGQVYGDFARVDVSQLRRHADLGFEVSRGNGALRFWADVSRGQLSGGLADLALNQVNATLGAKLQPLALQSVVGRLGGRRLAGGFELSTQGLQFQTAEGLRWPGGNLFLSYLEGAGRAPARGEIRADQLDLAALTQVAQRLPLQTATHAALAAYDARGLVETVHARWQGPLQAPTQYEARGRVVQLAIAGQPAAAPQAASAGSGPVGIPGVRGAAIDFELTQAGGKAKLAIEQGALDLPGVFAEPQLVLDRLSAEAQWQIEGDRIAVQVANAKLANADAQGELQASWKTSDPARSSSRSRFPGVLDLQGSLSRADGTRVHRYLPLSIAAEVRDYVREAVTQGRASDVRFRVKGDLHDMPFTDPRLGEFRIAAKVQNASFAFVPRSIQPKDALEWPALTQLSGELVFERAAMQVNKASARLSGAPGLQVSRVEARIPDLAHTTVAVSAEARGPLADMLKLVATSPMAGLIGHALDQASASGSADLRLSLSLPVSSIAQSRVQGSVTLAGNDVRITPETPLLARARGVVGFSESGFALSGAQASMLGGELRLEGGMRSVPGAGEAATLLRAQGMVTAEGLRQAHELGFLSRLAHNATGSAAYTATLGFRRGQPELMVASSLQGLALNLPPPLNKSAEAALPLRFENALLRESLASAGPLQDQLALELGRVASVVYVRDFGGPQVRVLRGAIGVGLSAGESAPLPDEGVAANINLAQLDLDAWENVLAKAAGTSVAPAAAAGAAAIAPAAMGYLPTIMAVRARELTLEGRKLHNVVVGGSREGLTWRANLDAQELNGYLEYRQPSAAGAGRVYARLARLNIAQSAAQDVESLLDEQPQNIPALDIVVDDLELRGRKLGRVEVEAVNRGAAARDPGAREWRLNKLNVILPEASFAATGHWAALTTPVAASGAPRQARERRRSVMNFKLDIADSGELLTRLGMKDVVRRGKGRMEGQVAWVGSPLQLDYPSLNGQFHVNVENGQFLKADPGLAKLLGVLSLQSLPRRLALDFRDVFSEGFAFDFVRGDIQIEQGMALTNNLQMKGVNAAVLMEGRADIARETQDLKVVVVPEINAGTASLVATAINPAIGLGSFLAQMFLRRPLTQAATQEFHIDGTWADPRITKVEHKPAAAEAKSEAKPGTAGGVTQ